MSYKIVVDSCGEIPKEKLAGGFYENVPLELDVDGERIVDDEHVRPGGFPEKGGSKPELSEVLLPVTQAVYAGL